MSLLPIESNYGASLLEVHWAAQLAAAASRLLTPCADYSHTNLLVEGECLQGRPLPDGRRAGLIPKSLTLTLGQASLELAGHTLSHGLAWLSAELGHDLSLLEHDLPERPRDAPFRLCGAESQLQAWFVAAQAALRQLAAVHGGSEVRLWPHHFDIATLVELDPARAESARSINLGLSPGDGAYPEPYWYVTPWPRPTGQLPALSVGHWHTAGFVAAVLPASNPQSDIPMRFLEATYLASLKLLQA
ncbi:MAG: hypothetical protein R3B07_31975 [Polyangiaceae bacterium]